MLISASGFLCALVLPMAYDSYDMRRPTSQLPTHLPTYLEAKALVEAHCVVVVHLHRMAIQLSKREALQRLVLDWQPLHDPLNREWTVGNGSWRRAAGHEATCLMWT